MNAEDFMGNGEWLKADELGGKTLTLEMCDVQAVTFDNENGKDTKLGIMFKGKEKGIIANKTNVKQIAAGFGNDTDGWIGKSLVVAPNQTPLGLGFSLRPAGDDFNDDIPF